MANTNNNQQARRHELIEEGTLAAQVGGAIRDEVNLQIETCVAQLVSTYRNGKIDHDLIIGKIGEIAGLQALMNNLQVKHERAIRALEQEVNNAP